jgi:SAM-dependent methyltransferase
VTQNIYDNPEFFAGYSQLLRSRAGLDGAAEWPTLRAMLPDMKRLRVLDLGCGFGWFCRWAREAGARSVKGVDVSEKMLERARADTKDGAITYQCTDLETFTLAAGTFDLIYSSLTFHYLVNLGALIQQIHGGLAPGGYLVFSAEHPIYTAPSDPTWIGSTWPIDRYLDEGPRTTDWLAKGVVKQHRTVASYINMLLRAGFSLNRIEEWSPSEAQISANPKWQNERQRPPFLLVSARRWRA